MRGVPILFFLKLTLKRSGYFHLQGSGRFNYTCNLSTYSRQKNKKTQKTDYFYFV